MTLNEVIEYDPNTRTGLPAETNPANANDAERPQLISELPDEPDRPSIASSTK